MNPIDEPLALTSDPTRKAYSKIGDPFTIYTHSTKTRTVVLAIFVALLAFFFLFVAFLKEQLQEMNNMPQFLANLSDTEMSYFVFYLLSGLSLLIALGILVYFMWAVTDIWGLQVCISNHELRVQNTITGSWFSKWMGVGSLKMEEIEELKGSRYATIVIGGNTRIRFSPVDKVDILISDILTKAKRARIKT